MTVPVIRLLTSDDLDGALALSTAAGWNQRPQDWRMLLRLAPRGSFAALLDDRIVGTSMGIDYGGFGWIAMMLVDPEYRGRGLGRRLLEAAIEALPSDRPIRLDATPLGRPLYERHGFIDEATLTRHVAQIGSARTSASSHVAGSTPPVRRLSAENLHGVIDQDAEVFGGDRTAVLAWAQSTAPQYAHVVQSSGGVNQYCFGREGRLFDQIGPVVAGDSDVAQALVRTAMVGASGRAIVVDAFDARSAFTRWLHDCGFQAQRPLFRMQRPAARQAPPRGRSGHETLVEFAILGPEFA